MSKYRRRLTADDLDAIEVAYVRGDRIQDIADALGRGTTTINAGILNLCRANRVQRRYRTRSGNGRPKDARLTYQQACILRALTEKRGKLVTKDEIIAAAVIRPRHRDASEKLIATISRIRSRLPGIRIEAVAGQGYVLHG